MDALKYVSPEAARRAAAESLRTDILTQPSFSVLAQVQPGFDDLAEDAAREALKRYVSDSNYSSRDPEAGGSGT